MKKGVVASIIIAVVIVVAVVSSVSIFRSHTNGQAISSGSQSNSETLFSQTSYYSFSYLIFPGTLSSDAKKAITGFNLMEQNNSDGSTTINLVATNPEYQNQTYTVQPGQKLYFIEKTLMDDSNDEDHFLTDDMAVVVNSQGYVVQGPGTA